MSTEKKDGAFGERAWLAHDPRHRRRSLILRRPHRGGPSMV
jgi:hypothetical protein